MTIPIRSEADIRAIEAEGLDAFRFARSPYELLRRAAVSWPNADAIVYVPSDGGSEERLSFRDLFDRVNQAAALFQRLAGGKDATIAVIMPHTLNAQVALWAAQRAGIACPINPMLQSEHIKSLLQASGCKIAVVMGVNGEVDVWGKVLKAARAVDAGMVVLDADSASPSAGSDGNFETLVAAESAARLDDPDPTAIAALYPTGGTTGAPKLTIHTHDNEAFVAIAAARMYDLGAGEVMLNGLPLFHVAGALVYGLSCVAAGAAQVVPGRLGMRNKPFVSTLWAQVERYRITRLGAVPTVLNTLLAQPVGTADISSLRIALTGGSLLPTDLADAFEAMTGIAVRNIFGMTECAGVLTVEPALGRRTPGSTGLRLPFTEIRVVVPDTSQQSPPGTTGLIAVRGPHISPGYLDPALGRDTFLAGGWLSTGDLGHIDVEGRVFLSGRAKDVIIRGGHNIEPSAIEDAIARHPSVALAAAVGLPDRHAGELPCVFVTLHPGAAATEDALLAFARDNVPEAAACPKRIWILDALPLTPVGKVFKPALRLEAAKYAVMSALSTLPSPLKDASVDAGEAGFIVVTARGSADDIARIRAALVGMPVEISCSG